MTAIPLKVTDWGRVLARCSDATGRVTGFEERTFGELAVTDDIGSVTPDMALRWRLLRPARI